LSPAWLQPLPHALSLPVGFKWRAWYGVMFLLPDDAVVQPHDPEVRRAAQVSTFGELWQRASTLAVAGDAVHSEGIGCGQGRRVTDLANSCGAGEIACWMQCMSTTGLEQCVGNIWRPTVGSMAEQVALSVQCLEPTSGKKWPEESGQHCKTCKPTCATSSPNAIPSPAPVPSDSDSEFCITMPGGSGTTMYMDGFKWTTLAQREVCVAFLFPGLVLNKAWKFALACLATILISVSLELIALVRKQTSNWCVKLLLQAVTLTLAYIAMLIVMTYSLELFCCVIFGLLLGPVITNHISKDKKDQATDEASAAQVQMETGGVGAGTPCCRMAAGLEHGE
jgi:hypothetical protein